MKKSILISLCLSTGLVANSQEIGGCVSYLADNYNPEATYNDGTCDYDLQQLLLDGASLGDLVFSGALESEIVGLFAAGGVVVDVDATNSRALIASAHYNTLHYGEESNFRNMSGGLDADEFLNTEFSNELYGGKSNWENIRRSYHSRVSNSFINAYNFNDGPFPFTETFALCQTLGYNDWYVPNQAEMLAYISMLSSNASSTDSSDPYASSISTVNWPTDPNGSGTSSLMRFPCQGFGEFDRAYITSYVLNSGAGPTDVTYRAFYRPYGNNDLYMPEGSSICRPSDVLSHPYGFRSCTFGGDCEWVDSGYSSSYDGHLTVLPMRTEILQPPATTNSCTDWQYGDAGNQAISAGVPCLYPLFQCDSVESTIWDELVIGAYPANTTVVEYGRDDTRDVLINIPSTHEIDDNIYEVVHYEVTGISDIPVGLDVNLSVGDSIAGGDVHCLDFSGTALSEGIYTVTIDGILRMDILGSVLQVDITMTHVIAVIPNVTGIDGCVYTSADNYDPLATVDDGTCTFGGLCPGDFDGDDLIGVTDILYLLGIYNSTCE